MCRRPDTDPAESKRPLRAGGDAPWNLNDTTDLTASAQRRRRWADEVTDPLDGDAVRSAQAEIFRCPKASGASPARPLRAGGGVSYAVPPGVTLGLSAPRRRRCSAVRHRHRTVQLVRSAHAEMFRSRCCCTSARRCPLRACRDVPTPWYVRIPSDLSAPLTRRWSVLQRASQAVPRVRSARAEMFPARTAGRRSHRGPLRAGGDAPYGAAALAASSLSAPRRRRCSELDADAAEFIRVCSAHAEMLRTRSSTSRMIERPLRAGGDVPARRREPVTVYASAPRRRRCARCGSVVPAQEVVRSAQVEMRRTNSLSASTDPSPLRECGNARSASASGSPACRLLRVGGEVPGSRSPPPFPSTFAPGSRR